MSQPAVAPEAELDDESYPSAVALRAAHSDLLRRERAENGAPAFLDEVRELVRRGRATGAILDGDADRRASQGILDYWAVALYRAAEEEPDSTLVPFDPTLAPTLPDELCPYVGLEAFRETSRERFFGRRRLTDDLLALVGRFRMVAILGPSGSGKSSLAQGGLIPALKAGALPGSQGWHVFPPMVPGSEPLANLARLTKPTGSSASRWAERVTEGCLQDDAYLAKLLGALVRAPAVLVVDQFEELFTLCGDARARNAFIANLLTLSKAAGPRHTVILTMRSDFESFVARLPRLQEQIQHAQLRVTPLSAGELREAIEEPARLAGLRFEPRVVDALINDILGEPAALPLLQFTLLKLWEGRDHNRVTWDAYRRLGGGRTALARSADAFYNGLVPEQQLTVRRILLRMVRPAEGGLEFTSSRVRREQLYKGGEAAERIDEVLRKLVQARLVRLTEAETPADAQVEVAHEALVRNWPTLVDWLEDEREALRERQRLAAAAEQWKALGENSGALLRGAVLDDALRLPAATLNRLERDFLRASVLARLRAEQEQEAARRRELDQARALAEEQQLRAEAERQRADEQLLRTEAQRQRADEQLLRAEAERQRADERDKAVRRRGRLLAVLLGVLCLAVIATIIAYRNAQFAEQQRSVAVAAQNTSQANEVAAVAAQNTSQASAATAVVAQSTAQAAQITSQANEAAAVVAQSTARAAQSVAQVNEATAVIARQTSQANADAALAAQQTSQANEAAAIAAQATSRADADALATAQAVAVAAEAQAVAAQQTAVAAQQTAVSNLDRSNAALLAQQAGPQTDNGVRRIQLAAAAVALDPGQMPVLQQAINDLLPPPTPVGASAGQISWSPDGQQFAAAEGGDTIRVWQTSNLEAGAIIGRQSDLTSLAWSADGQGILGTGADGTAIVWEVATGRRSRTLPGHQGRVNGGAWGANGQVATAGADRTIRIWAAGAASPRVIRTASAQSLTWAAWNNDGTRLATFSNNSVFVWNTAEGTEPLITLAATSRVTSAAWSPDGQRLLVTGDQGFAKVWNTATWQEAFALPGHSGAVNSGYWSPDGQLIATAGADRTVRVWDVATQQPSDVALNIGVPVRTAIWNPTGQRVLVATTAGQVWVAYADGFVAVAPQLAPPLSAAEVAAAIAEAQAAPAAVPPTPTATSTAAPLR